MDGKRTSTIFHSGEDGGGGKGQERSNGPETARTDWVTSRLWSEGEGNDEEEHLTIVEQK